MFKKVFYLLIAINFLSIFYCYSNNLDINEQLIEAINNKSIKKARELLSKGANASYIDENDDSALIYAVKSNNLDMVKLLICHGAAVDVIVGCLAALHYATSYDKKIMEYLLCIKADVNIRADMGETALYFAVIENNLEIVDLLLRYGADPNIKTYECETSCLHLAVIKGYKEIAKKLINAGADLNCQHKTDLYRGKLYTPLHYAVEMKDLETFKNLVTAGANLNLQDITGATPLLLAVCSRQQQMIEILINHNANPNLSTLTGLSPLTSAVLYRYKNPEIRTFMVKMLIKGGACVNFFDKNEYRHLHFAVHDGDALLVKLLLTSFKKLSNKQIQEFKTLIERAKEKGHIAIASLLMKHITQKSK